MIKGLSDQRWLPRLGHIRLGIKKKTGAGVEYPSEVDYFILDPKTPIEKRNKQLKDEFKKLYGPEPKAIKIMFPPAGPELFFSQWYKRYGKSTLKKCIGDGETATCGNQDFVEGLEVIGTNDFGQPMVKCEGLKCIHQTKKKADCHRMGTLQVLLPELTGIGVWQINTSSSNSIRNMNSAIDWLKGICGRFCMLPITLMRVETAIEYEGKKSIHYCLQIDQENIKLATLQLLAQTEPEKILLPGPDQSKDALFYDEEGKKSESKPDKDKPVEAEFVDSKPETPPDNPEQAAKKPKEGASGGEDDTGLEVYDTLDREGQEGAVRQMVEVYCKKKHILLVAFRGKLRNQFEFKSLSDLNDEKLKGLFSYLYTLCKE